MNSVLLAEFAEFLHFQFFLDFLFVARCKIVDSFAGIASHFHQIFPGHKIISNY